MNHRHNAEVPGARTFAENLALLPNVDDVARLELLDTTGNVVAVIENRPGSQGSLRLYCHLAREWGAITPDAAREGVRLYAEHSEDARRNPGKHPNIDRLFDAIASGVTYAVRRFPA